MADTVTTKTLGISSLNLYQKLAKITGEIGKIDKTGQSSGYGDRYTFIEYGAVAARLRDLFSKYGVVIVPRMQQSVKQHRADIVSKNGAKGSAVLIDFTFCVVNADKPDDKFTVTWTGEAADYGDKATNKAATAALKYYLMRQFNVSEKGEDPDSETHSLKAVNATEAEPVKAAAKESAAIRVTPKQLSEINTLFNQQGITDRNERLAQVADMVGHGVENSTHLTQAEADTVIGKLNEGGDQ